MKDGNKSGKAILICGIVATITVTVCAFEREKIAHKYYEYTIDKKYSKIAVNEYYKEDNFDYVDNRIETGIRNKKDLIDSIYYAINSGSDYIEKYIDISYTNYSSDIEALTYNDGVSFKNEVSILNNFVHPYNSSNNIKINYGGEYKIGISVSRAYSDDEISEINTLVDKILSEKVNNSMPSKEKIKVIHDYIIDHTEYDKLKYDNKNDNTYKSNTAYGVLIEGYGTCNGYADAMEIFLDKLNVINYKISNDEHIWNLVYLDGKWYHLDLTWDDPISDININRDTYFLIDTETLEKINDGTHSFDKSIYSEA